VIAVFVASPKQWKQHGDAPVKVDFWMRNLASLSKVLAKLNIPMLIETADRFDDCPGLIRKLAERHDCSSVLWNLEYEVNEARRDDATETELAKYQIESHSFHDRVVIPPADIETKDGRFYSVFTPYRRVWDSLLGERLNVLDKPPKQKKLDVEASEVPSKLKGYSFKDVRSDLWPAGEDQAGQRLHSFCNHVFAYDTQRDLPSVNGTSLLSPYLAAGVISPNQCVSEILAAANNKLTKDSGPSVWISELTWRDFYAHVMVGFPRVSMDQPFKPKTRQIQWRDDAEDLLAWKQGRTGYPIVDAGMRQLNQTGWMHNRVRMVTAMFLTKNLLIDWRLGEQFFMENLVDGDLAANNGGWQWSASTGTDAVPYFRIFNPFSQSKRFDVDGEYIKRFCPELQSVPAKQLHDVKKFAAAVTDLDYPGYIVDYKEGRERALAAFKAIT